MSRTQSKKPAPSAKPQVSQTEATQKQLTKEEKRKRIFLIGVAIFCLVIFSVTGPMTMVFARWFGGGPGDVATVVLPKGGKQNITAEDWQEARNLLVAQQQVYFGGQEINEDTILATALKTKLADELEIEVPDETLRQAITTLMSFRQTPSYQDYLQRLGFRSSIQYETLLRRVLRIQTVDRIFGSFSVGTTVAGLDWWKDEYQEMQLEYAVWEPDQFVDAAQNLEPEEEELQTFYDEGLSFQQRRDLENEEAAAFEAVVLTADSLETEAVKSWAPEVDSSDDALQGFYDFRRFSFYLRPSDDTSSTEPFLSREELGDDRLKRDLTLYETISSLVADLETAEDVAAFAAERGLELIRQEEMVARTDLEGFERLGHRQLQSIVSSEANKWVVNPILVDDLVYLVRPTETRTRELPPLEEIRDSVVDYWREKRQGELAQEAAQAFYDNLPKPEDFVDGDALTMSRDDYGRSVAEDGKVVQVLPWVSRITRTTTDPKWTADDQLKRWLRDTVGRELEDYLDDQVLGPYEHPGTNSSVVVRLAGRRPADASKIWPNELQSARSGAIREARQRFNEEEISYGGLSRAYEIEKILRDEANDDV